MFESLFIVNYSAPSAFDAFVLRKNGKPIVQACVG